MPGGDPLSSYQQQNVMEWMDRMERDRRRREKYDRLHANYDDPPRPGKRWWQFWKREVEPT